MQKTKSISKVNLFSWISTIVLISLVFSVFFIYQQYTKFKRDSQLLHDSYLNYKKDLLKNDADNIVNFLKTELKKDILKNPYANNSIILGLKNKLRIMQLGKAHISIIDQQGLVLFSSKEAEENKIFASPEVLKKILTKAKSPSGGLIYSIPAGSEKATLYYSKPLGENWVVCAELNEEAIVRAYAANKERLKIDIILETALISLLALIVIGAALRFSMAISKSLKQEIGLIREYLKNSFKGGKLDPDGFKYEEFRFIGSSSVDMVTKIKDLMEKVKAIAVNSEINYHSKSIIIDDVSHEIRNNLNSIKGTADLLIDSAPNDEHAERFRTISASARAIAELLNNITLFSDDDNIPIMQRISAFEVTELHQEIIPRISRNLKEKRIDFVFKTEDDVPEILAGSKICIKQILLNFIENAIQFTEKGSISLILSKESQKENNCIIKFEITDTGFGISEKKLKFISDIAHEEIAVSPRFTAAALKISVCKKLIKTMNGEMLITSKKDQGTKVTFTLPLEAAQKEDIEGKDKKADTIGKGLHVLIVEDDQVNRDVERLYLTKMGFLTDTAVHGLDALTKLKDHKYDLIFMDYEMPELDGVETTKRIRKMEKETGEHITIIALTGFSRDEEKHNAMEAGMDDYVLKPFEMETVLEVLKKHIKS